MEKSYEYYLIARLAIDERMKKSNFFGLNKVSASIRTGLAEVRAELGDQATQSAVEIYMPDFLKKRLLAENVKELEIKVDEIKSGYNINIKRLSNNYYWSADMLLCYGEISYCKKTDEVRLFVPKTSKVDDRTEGKKFRMDNFKVKKGEIHFYQDKKLMLSVADEIWLLKAEKQTTSSKEMHKFVSIEFEIEGRTYDYLCDGIEVKVGDMVMVPSMQGPKQVKVVRVFEQSEADAPLEITRYKSVINE